MLLLSPFLAACSPHTTDPLPDYVVQEECNGIDDDGDNLVDDEDPSAIGKPWRHPSGRVLYVCDPMSFAGPAVNSAVLAEFVPVEL